MRFISVTAMQFLVAWEPLTSGTVQIVSGAAEECKMVPGLFEKDTDRIFDIGDTKDRVNRKRLIYWEAGLLFLN